MTALPRPVAWLWIAGLAAAAMLAAVHLLESVGGYPPCELCLHQREALWTVLAVAAAGLAAARLRPVLAPVAVVGVGVAFAVGAGVAAFHAGVEWRWWAGPATCTGLARGPVSAADVAAILSGAGRLHVVRCDEAAFRIAALSPAGWNALASGALALMSFFVLLRPAPPSDRRP